MNTDLVTVNNGVASTTSLAIAEQLGRAHKNVLKSLDKLAARRGFEPSSYIDDSGKANRMYVLNERQALIAMPFIGGLKSEEGQVALVDAFLALRNYAAKPTPLEQRIEQLELLVLQSKQVAAKSSIEKSILSHFDWNASKDTWENRFTATQVYYVCFSDKPRQKDLNAVNRALLSLGVYFYKSNGLTRYKLPTKIDNS